LTVVPSAELAPAGHLDEDALAALFTAVYEGYWHPIEIDGAALRRMTATYDLDADASVVALDGGVPIGLAMLAVRADRGWIGGMGVVPERRGAGIGEQLTRRLVENARDRGVRRVTLEVLEQNAPAIAIYRRVGFAELGDVAVWSIAAPPDGGEATDADFAETLADLAARLPNVPWQRNPGTVANMRALGSQLVAVRTDRGRAVYAMTDVHASLLQLDAPTRDEAAALLRAPFARGAGSLFWLNGPSDGVAAAVLRDAGATPLALQHELQLELG
jgi:ribosomal protein S18 acetylase RimI-like enzyme